MLFATFQSDEVGDLLKAYNYKAIVGKRAKVYNSDTPFVSLSKKLGYAPIFCIPLNTGIEDILFRFALTSPSVPQRLIVFESDNYEELSYISWSECTKTGNAECVKMNSPNSFNEYVVREIKVSSVVRNIVISNNPVTDEEESCHNDALSYVFSKRLSSMLYRIGVNDEKRTLPHFEDLLFGVREGFMKYMFILDIASSEIKEEDIDEFKNFIVSNLIISSK